MKFGSILFPLSILVIGSQAGSAQELISTNRDSVVAASSSADKTQDDLKRQQVIDLALAPIKSQADLMLHLQNVPLSESPLRFLSPSARQRFLASLVFGESGVGGYGYSDLQTELSPTQVYQVLSLFGLQSTASLVTGLKVSTALDSVIVAPRSHLPGDRDNYRCLAPQNPHTCRWSALDICTHLC